MFRQVVWSFVVVIVYLGSGTVKAEICGEDKDALLAAVEKSAMECVKELGVTEKEVAEFQKENNFEEMDPCFLSCFFKKTGHLDSQGMYDSENAKAFTRNYIKSEDDLAKIDDVKDACKTVNDEDVSDGVKGCDRAVLMVKCFMAIKHDITW